MIRQVVILHNAKGHEVAEVALHVPGRRRSGVPALCRQVPLVAPIDLTTARCYLLCRIAAEPRLPNWGQRFTLYLPRRESRL